MKWKVYYTDGSAFSSSDGEWNDAPAWGVLGLAVIGDNGYTRVSNDYYLIDPDSNGEPWGVDLWGLVDYLIRVAVMRPTQALAFLPPANLIRAGVKFGRSVTNQEWHRFLSMVKDDPDMPRKTTRRRSERPGADVQPEG